MRSERNGQVKVNFIVPITFTKLTPTVQLDIIYQCLVVVCVIDLHFMLEWYCLREKEEIWLSPMTKAPTSTEKSKKQRDNTQTPPKPPITQRLWTDLGRIRNSRVGFFLLKIWLLLCNIKNRLVCSGWLRTVSWGNDNHRWMTGHNLMLTNDL